jgi:NADP-dependent 3-hydroxy acid dehydrogenase YdfG
MAAAWHLVGSAAVARGVAVVTGASSGIGAATATALVEAGFEVVVGARRLDRLREVAEPLGALALPLDVTDAESVQAFAAEVRSCQVLVANAGGALGLEPVAEADEERWRSMYEVNVLGTLRTVQAFLPALVASGDGQVVVVGSIAPHDPKAGGAGYNAAKAGEAALARVLRLELLGQPVRVSEVDPGMVETEFSLVRFAGDRERADAVYAGVEPLTAEDVAACIAFVATRPAHVNVDRMVVLPRDQAGTGPGMVSRRPT